MRRARRDSVVRDASFVDPVVGRAGLRRRALADADRPAVVWARPAGEPAVAEGFAPMDAAPAAPVVEHDEPQTVEAVVLDAVIPAAVAVAAAVEAVAPLTRRAARVRTAPQPVVAEEPVAASEAAEATEPTASPAPAQTSTATAGFELLEPVAPIEAEVAPRAESAAPVVDEFEAAARLFSFTGETPIQAACVEPDAEAADASAHVPPRGKARAPRKRVSSGAAFKRVAAASLSMSAMTVVGLLAVGMTTPASAVASSDATGALAAASVQALPGDVEVGAEDIQAYVAPAQVENVEIDRPGSYETASMADLAAEDDIQNFSSFFTNDPTAAIQWPFPVGVPISYGFGMRSGRMHEGVDFTPGNGAKIQAVADGVVRIATNSGGGYGVTVYIDHIIDGKLVTSHYAHMQYNSIRVKVGQHVKVGQIIGIVGNTGHSFGAHLHFEILENGTTPIDPLAWLRKNAGRASLG